MIFVDTGAFLSNFVNSDPDHISVKTIFEKNYEELVTTSDVIAETINWLTRKVHSKLVQDVGIVLLEGELARIINIDYEDRLEALDTLKKYSDQKLNFTDATSFAVIKRLKIKKVLSLDKHFNLIKGAENLCKFS